MIPAEQKIPLVAVVGPTASGKTRLGVSLAEALNGEVVSADSMQIYQGMDIATAMPTPEETAGIPHHLIRFLSPEEPFSLADYVKRAQETVANIHGRGKMPILVGGTGLYINTLLDNITLSNQGESPQLRAELAATAATSGNGVLLEELRKIDPESAAILHENNLTRIIRAIEVYRLTGIPMSTHIKNSRLSASPYTSCMLGIHYENRQLLYDRINRRVDQMISEGLLEEASQSRSLGRKTAAGAIGHKELEPYFLGEASLEVCVERLKQSTRRYAKRQLTWFRRDSRIHWLDPTKFEDFSQLLNCSLTIVETAFE